MISVIVPVYNVEKYIDKCVKSILSQSYKDYELVLVDDGSQDNSPAFCDAYANKYENVYVIHKENGGLSDARNVGTTFAHGEYVTYIDSDDYVDKDYLLTLSGLVKKYNAEIAVTGIKVFFEGEAVSVSRKNITEYCYSGMEALENMLFQNTLDTSACAMLIPTEIARKYPFPIGKYHEDEFTTFKYYSAVNKVAVTTEQQYFYLQRRNSIMHSFGQASLDELDAADNLVRVCELYWPELIPAGKCKRFSDYCQVLLNSGDLKKENYEMYCRIKACLMNSRRDVLFCNSARIKNRIAALVLYLGTWALKLLAKGLKKVR